VPIAIVTGASRGLGLALTTALVGRGWEVIVDARDPRALRRATAAFDPRAVTSVPGDVTDPSHRAALTAIVRERGRLDLLVHNASDLGPSPLPTLADLDGSAFTRTLATNVVAPLALTRLLLPELRLGGTVGAVSSDAAVEAYAGWGGYGASKAALDLLIRVLAIEEPRLRAYAFDPGDMRTAMHQAAFPGADISDRPEPETVVPALLWLLDGRPPSGRYRAADLAADMAARSPAGSSTGQAGATITARATR
jgi:NAD(P)-dependent dehydrogenase (short-subunit alcohol dehydrogenase family)